MKDRRFTAVLLCLAGLFLVLGATNVMGGAQSEAEEPAAPAAMEAEAAGDFVASMGNTKWWPTVTAYRNDTGKNITKFNESPMLAAKVKAGQLPPIEQRLPKDPFVVQPYDVIGRYSTRPLRMTTIGDIGGGFHHLLTMDFCRGLGRWDRSGTEILPDVLKGWELTPDAKSITLYLREGMKWSDGVPITADDIVFWWEDVQKNPKLIPETASPFMPGGELMEAEKVDDYAVRFNFAVPYGGAATLFVANWSYRLMPKHFYSQFHIDYNKDADKVAAEYGYEHWWQLFGALQGSTFPGFILTEEINREYPMTVPWVYGRKVTGGLVFERNPYYHQVDTAGNQLPYIDQVLLTRVEDAELYTLKALAGEADYCSWGMPLNKYPLFLKEAENGKYRVAMAGMAYGSNFSLITNMTYNEDPVLADIIHDVRFRQAISIAFDRDEINETLFFGQGVPRNDTVTPPAPYYKPEWASDYAQYDPDGANKILDEMGLKWDSAKEYRLRPDGKRLQVTVTTTSEMFEYYVPMLEIIISDWKKIGIEGKMDVVSKQMMYDRLYSNEAQIWARTMTVTTQSGFVAFEAYWWRAKWWAPLWDAWLQSGGERGEEPPEWVKTLESTIQTLRYLKGDDLNKAMTTLLDISAEQLFKIGTIGMIPEPTVIANDLRNVPERFWSASAVGPQGILQVHPEEFFWVKD